MSIRHKIKMKNGELKDVLLTRQKAIAVFCTQCCGYGEVHPKECDIEDCSLYPYRAKSNLIFGKEGE